MQTSYFEMFRPPFISLRKNKEIKRKRYLRRAPRRKKTKLKKHEEKTAKISNLSQTSLEGSELFLLVHTAHPKTQGRDSRYHERRLSGGTERRKGLGGRT